MNARFVDVILVVVVAVTLVGCRGDDPQRSREDRTEPEVTSLFTKLPTDYTNIDFENRLVDTEEMNIFTYRNYYNGGGVGVGDFTGDGRPDLYLVANQGPNRLYLNRGNFWFEDVTDEAGVGGEQVWSTGVSVADVNGDGRLDIYVSNAGDVEGDNRANELFVNQGLNEEGIPVFEERAAAYGIDDQGYSTHAIFFDYDKDGHLDLYVLNNTFRSVESFGLRNTRHIRDEEGGDKLYHNNGDGTFTDVSEETGIYGSDIAFGLGATIGDVNRDGWPDIYISNDFFERDYLYLNGGNGTFEEVLPEQMPVISHFSMGADMGDVNNDGWPEIYVTDMLPESDRRLKTTSTFETWDVYQDRVRNDFHYQYMRNTLQLNNQDGTFSEIAQIAGVHATDWSWGALMADFDNDGHKDLFVANGIYRDLTDQDFVDFFANDVRQSVQTGKRRPYEELLEHIPSTPISNYAFHNNGDLTFASTAEAWGLDTPSFSNGAAYADLNGDGALELIVNNVNQEVFVYRNEAPMLHDNRYLQIGFEGETPNRFGLGAQVTIEHDDQTIYYEHMPMRGFQSSVGYGITAGVGTADTLDAVTVIWPDGRMQVMENVATNQRVVVRQQDAVQTDNPEGKGLPEPDAEADADRRFADVTDEVGLDYTHVENDFSDFNREPLLPKKLSTEGPRLAVEDITGNGLDDVYIGGAKDAPGQLFLQQRNGQFVRSSEEAFEADAGSEDTGAVFFDATGNGHLDLYVVSGGNEFSPRVPGLRDRLYINDGRGAFTKANDHLPRVVRSGSCVRPADFDGDGATDLFVGTRVTPWRYGLNPSSTILRNDGTGRFTDVTDEVAPDLNELGMVTDAAWADVTGNGRLDLVVVGEWMPIVIFENTGQGTLKRMNAPDLAETNGWWNRVVAEDLTGNGHVDFIVGNLGENTRMNVSPEHPVTMHVGDFSNDGHLEQIISSYSPLDDATYPFDVPGVLFEQMTFLQKKYTSHEAFAEERVEDMLSDEQLRQAVVQRGHTFQTSIILNQGNGTFEVVPLPYEAQLSPVYGIVAEDFDSDGHMDLLLAGNFYGFEPKLGRMAASYGLYLRGDGTGSFEPVPARASGFRVHGEVRDMQPFRHATRGELILIAKNDDDLQVVQPQ